MLSNIIKPGDKIELQRVERMKENTTEVLNKKIYHSKVCEILSEDRLEITMPIEKGKLIPLQVDSEYDLFFYTANGLYQCFARVVDRYKSNNIYIILVEMTSNLRKQQRREYYRFGCALEINARDITEEELQEAMEGKHTLKVQPEKLNKGVIVDISGGGLRFVIDQKYEENSLVNCIYNLFIDGKKKEYNLVGKVLSVKELSNRPGVYEHRIQYININTSQREEIIRYIFQEERKNRKKENNS